jgi:hypothetical protein
MTTQAKTLVNPGQTHQTERSVLYFSEYQVNYHLAMAVCCLANKVAKRSTACCPR